MRTAPLRWPWRRPPSRPQCRDEDYHLIQRAQSIIANARPLDEEMAEAWHVVVAVWLQKYEEWLKAQDG